MWKINFPSRFKYFSILAIKPLWKFNKYKTIISFCFSKKILSVWILVSLFSILLHHIKFHKKILKYYFLYITKSLTYSPSLDITGLETFHRTHFKPFFATTFLFFVLLTSYTSYHFNFHLWGKQFFNKKSLCLHYDWTFSIFISPSLTLL